MLRSVLPLLLVLCCASSARAQEDAWATFVAPDSSFSVLMPRTPSHRTEMIRRYGATSKVLTVTARTDSAHYMLRRYDLGYALRHSLIDPRDVTRYFLETAVTEDTSGSALEWNGTWEQQAGSYRGILSSISSDTKSIHLAFATTERAIYEFRIEAASFEAPAFAADEDERFISSLNVFERDPQEEVLKDSTDYLLQASREIAAQVGMKKLSTLVLPPGDVEVRLWAGFGLAGVWGYILRCEDGQWIPIFVQDRQEQQRNLADFRVTVEGPTARYASTDADWKNVWQRLREAGLREAGPGKERLGFDGFSIVLEVLADEGYSSAVFSFPNHHETPTDKRIMRIYDILAEAFDIGTRGS